MSSERGDRGTSPGDKGSYSHCTQLTTGLKIHEVDTNGKERA